MFVISLIFSGLALLAVVALVIGEKKRSQKRNAAIIQYLDAELESLKKKIAKLESGVTPDYEEAKKAADAINDFNRGISSILGFDPYEAMRNKERKEQNGGDMTE